MKSARSEDGIECVGVSPSQSDGLAIGVPIHASPLRIHVEDIHTLYGGGREKDADFKLFRF